MKTVEATDAGLAQAAQALRDGKIIAYPTETVYGLGTDPMNQTAVEALFRVKGRDQNHPILLVVSALEQLEQIAAFVPDSAYAYIKAFWPGPLSLLFPRHPDLPMVVTAGAEKVCVRWSSHPTVQALCESFGGAITSSSANRSSEPPARELKHAALEGVALGIDGGPLDVQAPSTVYDPELHRILRPGPITQKMLAEVIKVYR